VYVDFTSGAVDHRRRFGGGKGQDIAKAVGLNKRSNLSVLDATAVWGEMLLSWLVWGVQSRFVNVLVLLERCLQDGLYRASFHHEVAEIVAKMPFARY